jgi:hypothetical protein
MAEELMMGTFEMISFNGNTYDDDVEKGIRWGRGRGLKIGGAIEVVLGTLGK